MIPAIDTLYKNLQNLLDELLHQVSQLSYAQQNYKPAPDSWSILQIFRHMIQSEEKIYFYLSKKILGVHTIGRAGLGARIRSLVLNLAMRLPIKYKVPDAIKVEFEENYDFEKLSADWLSLRDKLKTFLEHIDEETARKEIFRHPVAGRMNILHGLSFMDEHLSRHKRQVEKIYSALQKLDSKLSK